jgi:transcriptional regulator with XRE-family HTH domain
MSYGELLRKWRLDKRKTQRQLAEEMGCSESYITHLENEVRLPSLSFCVTLAEVLELTGAQQQEFLEAVEVTRQQGAAKRLFAAGTAVRKALGMRGLPATLPMSEMSEQDLAHELATTPELAAAYRNLRAAFAVPRLRQALLVVLEGFSRMTHGDNG